MKNVYLKAALVTTIVGILITSLFYYWNEQRKDNPAVHRLSLIDKMETDGVPIFTGVTHEGIPFDLKNLKGSVVILNFWASWCGPCVEEFPSMIELIEAMDGKVKLVAISEDNTEEEMRIFLKSFPKITNSNIFVIYDKDRQIGRSYNADRLPESFIAGKDLKLYRKIVGSIDWNTPEARAYMQNLIDKP